MLTIKELAVKCGAKNAYSDRDDIFIIDTSQLQAFADEWLALNSSEPVAWWALQLDTEEPEIQLFKTKNDVLAWQKNYALDNIKSSMFPLYKANSINQELVEALTWMVTIHDDAEARMYDGGTTRAKVRELLKKANAAIPKPLKELK